MKKQGGTSISEIILTGIMVKNKIKILQVLGKFNIGGAEKVALTLTKEFKKRGWDITLCIREDGNLRGIVSDDIPIIIPRKYLFDFKYLSRLCSLIKDLEVDIVHSHTIGSGMYGLIAAKLTGKKFIFTIHGNSSFIDRKKFYAQSLLANHSDKIITVSDQLYSLCLDKFNITEDKLFNVMNGIDLSKLSHEIDRKKKQEELQIHMGEFIISAVGNVKYIKGYDVLIESFSEIKKVYRNVKLLIVGNVVDENDRRFKIKLEKLISDLNMQRDIIFLGFRNDVHEILMMTDIYVLPSRSEGTSLSLLEAMAAKRPIIATNVGGTPFVIDDKYSGLLVPPEDSDALSMAIIKLLRDRELALALGEKAGEKAREKFSLDSMIDSYAKIYREVMHK